jgi:hypothetical protein
MSALAISSIGKPRAKNTSFFTRNMDMKFNIFIYNIYIYERVSTEFPEQKKKIF